MRKMCRGLARGTQSDERALMFGFFAIGTSVVVATLFHLIA
jgi:hypothetical protein